MIIGISGKAEAGKDLIAAHLVSAHGYTRRAFADALKVEFYQDLFGHEDHHTDEEAIAWANSAKAANTVVRSHLQELGQARREDNPGYWIDRLFAWSNYRNITDLAIPDVRYTNEAEAIKARGGLVIRVERPGHRDRLTPEQRAHPSECDLDDYEGFDLVLENTGTVEDLASKFDFAYQVRDLVAAHRPIYYLKEYA